MKATFEIETKIGDRVGMRKRVSYLIHDYELGEIQYFSIENDAVVVKTDHKGLIWQGGIMDFIEIWEDIE